MNFPITYKAVELPAYNSNLLRAIFGLTIIEKTIKSVDPEKLLIKMEAAPCNPSDIAFMQGGYAIKKNLPAVPGFEGAGIVVAAGTELDASQWIGKRVACFTQSSGDGTWAEYLSVSSRQAIVVDERLTIEQAACFFINPFTAVGLLDIAIQNKSKGIMINAAGGLVAKYLFTLAKKQNINVLAIVRKEETAIKLKQQHGINVLVSGDENFEMQLTDAVEHYLITTVFDAVGGEMTGLLANVLPKNGNVVVYGGLSGKAVGGVDLLQLIFNGLKINGFNLNEWMKNTDRERFREVKSFLEDIMLNEVPTTVSVQVGIDEVVSGLKYYLGAMSAGKMLIKF